MREILLKNKKATWNYDIIDTYEAGIKLKGHEVKSLKQKHGTLLGSYVVERDNKIWLKNTYIPPYQPNNTPEEYDPYQLRQLLLTKKQTNEIKEARQAAGLTIIPTSIINKGKRIVVELALARGKRKHDKRETIKKREDEREIRRKIKTSLR